MIDEHRPIVRTLLNQCFLQVEQFWIQWLREITLTSYNTTHMNYCSVEIPNILLPVADSKHN